MGHGDPVWPKILRSRPSDPPTLRISGEPEMTAGTMSMAAGGATTTGERKPINKWLVTVSITFGTLMGAIDASIVNVAVPHLTGSLGVTVEQITWVTTGFVIATVMVMPLFGMAVVLGPAFGPTLGGYIVDNYSWPWIFYINVPIGVVSLLMVSRFVHEPPDVRASLHLMAERQRKNMDWYGIALLVVGLGTMQYVLEEGNRNDWFESFEIKTIAFVAIVSLTMLVIRELSARLP